MTGAGIKTLSNPMALIGILIGVAILTSVATNIFPTVIQDIVDMSTLANFTFASFFEASGVLTLILSAIILLTILAMFGVKGLTGKR